MGWKESGVLGPCQKCAEGGSEDKKPFYAPPRKKGARAWENAARNFGVSSLDGDHTPRLLAHGVNDTTNGLYAKMVRRWLRNCRRNGVTLGSISLIDKSIAAELDQWCFSHVLPVACGQQLYWGACHMWPEFHGNLPYARRALHTWEKYETVNERMPARKSTLVYVRMAEQGLAELAFIGYLALDCYFRGGDWDSLLGEDVFVSKSSQPGRKWQETLKLGRKHRGERTKTGSPEQGVEVDEE